MWVGKQDLDILGKIEDRIFCQIRCEYEIKESRMFSTFILIVRKFNCQ